MLRGLLGCKRQYDSWCSESAEDVWAKMIAAILQYDKQQRASRQGEAIDPALAFQPGLHVDLDFDLDQLLKEVNA